MLVTGFLASRMQDTALVAKLLDIELAHQKLQNPPPSPPKKKAVLPLSLTITYTFRAQFF